MRRKPALMMALFVSGLLWFSWASARQEPAELWSSLSISRPLFHAGGTKELSLFFTLVNDGSKTVDPKIESSKIIINDVEVENSGFIFGNGPKDGRWHALPPGDSLEFNYSLEDYFKEPGIYRVSWRGENFVTQTIVFRVMPDKSKP